MTLLAVVLVALLHISFFAMESLLWTTPRVRRIFGNSAEKAETTRILALNQGAYNLGAAGLLLWLQLTGNPAGVSAVLVFLAAMGLVGGFSANRIILGVQTLPAVVALVLLGVLAAVPWYRRRSVVPISKEG